MDMRHFYGRAGRDCAAGTRIDSAFTIDTDSAWKVFTERQRLNTV